MNNDTDIPTFFEHNRLGTVAMDKYGQVLNETNDQYSEMYFQHDFSFNASSNNVTSTTGNTNNATNATNNNHNNVSSSQQQINNLTQSQQMFQHFLSQPTTNLNTSQQIQHQQILQLQAQLQAQQQQLIQQAAIAAAAQQQVNINQQPISPPQSLPQYQSQSSPPQNTGSNSNNANNGNNNYNDTSYNVPSPSQDLMSLLQAQQQTNTQPSSHQLQQQQNNNNNGNASIQSIQAQIQAIQQLQAAQQASVQLPSIKQQIAQQTQQQQFNDSYSVPNYSPITTLDHTPSSPLSTNHSIPSSPYQFTNTPLQVDEAIMNNSLSQFAQTYNTIEQQQIQLMAQQPIQQLQQINQLSNGGGASIGNYLNDDDDEESKSKKKKKSSIVSTSSSSSSKSSSSKMTTSPISASSKLSLKSKELTQKEKSSEKCRKAIEEHKKRPVGAYNAPTIEFLPRDLIPEPNSVTNNHIITPPTVIRLNLPNAKSDFSNFWVTARLTEKDKFKIDYTKEHFDWDGYCTFNIKIEKPKGNEKTEFFKIRYDLFCEDSDGNPLYMGNIVSDQIRYCYHTSSLPNPKIEFISPSCVNPLAIVPKLELNSSFFKHGDAHPLVVLFLDKFGKTVQHQQRPTKSNWTSEWSINIDTPVLPPGVYKVYAVYLKKNEDITSSLINNLNQDFSCDIYYSENTILSNTSLINNYNNSGNNGGNGGNNNNGGNGNGNNNGGGNNNNNNGGNGFNGGNGNNNNGGGNNFFGGGNGGDAFNFNNYELGVGADNQFFKIYIEISKSEPSQLSKYETYRNIVNENTGDSLLMYSILSNDVSTFEKILSLKTNVAIKNNALFNALHFAAYNQVNSHFFNRLLELNNSEIEQCVNSTNHFGKNVIHMLAEIKNVSSIIKLLGMYPSLFSVVDTRGFIALHYFVLHRDELAVNKLIEFWENSSNETTSSITCQTYSSGMNVLHLACALGNVKIVNRLLKTRAFDLYQQDFKDEYCINKAIDNQKFDVIRLLKFIGFDISLVIEEMKSVQSDLDDYDEDETTFTSRCQLDYIPKSYTQLVNKSSTTVTKQPSTTTTTVTSSSSSSSSPTGEENELINRLIKLSHSDSSSYKPSSLSHLPKSSSGSSGDDTTTHLLSETQSSSNGDVTFTFGSSNKRLDEIVEQLANKIRNLETTNKTLEQKIASQQEFEKQRDPSDPTEETYLDAINRFVKGTDQTYQRVDKKTGKTVILSSETMSAFKDNCKFLPSNIIGKIIASTEKDDKLIVDVDFYFENDQNLV